MIFSDYQDNLKKKIITEEMLADCLYSVNKRAKNYRDKANEYKGYYGKYHQAVDSQYDKMKQYYKYKEDLLTYVKAIRIHKQFIGNERIRVYSYEKNYYRVYFNKYKENKIVWENSYYDYNRDEWNIEYEITVEDLNKLIKYQENRQKKVKY